MILWVKLSMVSVRQFLVLSLAVTFLLASVGSVHVYGSLAPSLLAVVRGTDNGVYYNICSGTCQTPATTSWGGWNSLSGGTLSAPTFCTGEEATGDADLVLRGTDNGIYHRAYASGSWASSWDTPGGATNDQPACVEYNGFLYVVVRGTDNSLYFNQYNTVFLRWGSWVALGGATSSPPTLIYDDYSSNPRLELFVRGTDNGIYHKAGTISAGLVTWAGSWESFGGTTPSAVSAAWGTGADDATVWVLVQGTDNNIYYLQMLLGTGTSDRPVAWISPRGSTLNEMGLGRNTCSGYDALFLEGTDKGLYGTAFSTSAWSTVVSENLVQTYASAGGTLTAPPALTLISGDEAALVVGTGGGIYYNVFVEASTPSTAWQGYVGLGGATPSTPAIANIATSC
jgi:hypothetical protein